MEQFASAAQIITAITIALTAVIILISVYLYGNVRKGNSLLKKWSQIPEHTSIPDGYAEITAIFNKYKKTIDVKTHNCNKTTVSAYDVFSTNTVLRAIGVNPALLKASAGMISGLGVLGTFIGLAISVAFFKYENSQLIMESIKALLSGMGTAFITSIAGMICSSFFMGQEKSMVNNLHKRIDVFCSKLDDENYISSGSLNQIMTEDHHQRMIKEAEAMQQTITKAFEALSTDIAGNIEHATTTLSNSLNEMSGLFVCEDDEGEPLKIGTMLLDVYEESTKQTRALASFTTDLSNQLNASLVKTMDSSIVPLIQGLENSHNQMLAQIQSLGTSMTNPATDMVDNMVSDLKSSMTEIISEFKKGISEDTTEKMELLANRLAETANLLNAVPQSTKLMAENVEKSFSNVEKMVLQLQQSSSDISKETMQYMQGQLSTMADSLNNTVIGLQGEQEKMVERNKETNESTANMVKEQLNVVLGHFDDITRGIDDCQHETLKMVRTANEESVGRLRTQFDEIMTSFKSLSDKIALQQDDLVLKQSTSMKEVERLLASFNASIEMLRNSNNETGATLSKLANIGTTIDDSANNLKSLASTLANTAEELAQQQDARMNEYKALQDGNEKLLEDIMTANDKAKDLMITYSREYPVIKDGLTDIFNNISEGLQEYSKTLRNSTSDALTEYAQALDGSTKALQNIAINLTEAAEELTDSIENISKK